MILSRLDARMDNIVGSRRSHGRRARVNRTVHECIIVSTARNTTKGLLEFFKPSYFLFAQEIKIAIGAHFVFIVVVVAASSTGVHVSGSMDRCRREAIGFATVASKHLGVELDCSFALCYVVLLCCNRCGAMR